MTMDREPDADVSAIAEAVVDLLVDRGLVIDAGFFGARVLTVNGVAEQLGRNRSWVYEHAGELGAFRYGDTPKARLGFDAMEIERWKREHRIRPPEPPPVRRRGRPRALPRKVELIPYEPLPESMRLRPRSPRLGDE